MSKFDDEYVKVGYGHTVRRPNSKRQVSAVRECNRLAAKVKELEARLDRDKADELEAALGDE